MRTTTFKILALLLISFSYFNLYGQEKLQPSELKPILGKWEGSLTYIDYSSGKPYTMPANLRIELGKNARQLILFHIYPNEPKANSKGRIALSKKGDFLNKKMITSVDRKKANYITVITTSNGKDNKKKAAIRNTYILGPKKLVIRKEVKFANATKWLKRNEFSYTR